MIWGNADLELATASSGPLGMAPSLRVALASARVFLDLLLYDQADDVRHLLEKK